MADRAPAHATRWLWPLLALPGTAWLAVFFVAPMYVVLAILFGIIALASMVLTFITKLPRARRTADV